MSNKNKLENKSLRRSERANITLVDRTPVSLIAQKTSARILSSPKQKMTGSTRRRLQRSRGFVVSVEAGTPSLLPEVKVALKLEALPMVKLIRRLKQACRRAATCGYLLRDLAHDSKYTASIKAEQTHQISLCGQIHAEMSFRNHNTKH